MFNNKVYVVTHDERSSNKVFNAYQQFVGVYGTLKQAEEAIDEKIHEITHLGGAQPVQQGTNDYAVMWKSVNHPFMINDTMEDTYYILERRVYRTDYKK